MRRGKPLSDDLRWRIIDAWLRKKLSEAELVDLFSVSPATVRRLKKTWKKTRGVLPKNRGGGRRRLIPREQEGLVEALVQQHPDWSEDRYAQALQTQHGISAAPVTVGRLIRRLGYSIKKKRSLPPKGTRSTSGIGGSSISEKSSPSPLRVWFLWTKPAPTPP